MADKKQLIEEQIAEKRESKQRRNEKAEKRIQNFKDNYLNLRSNLGENGRISKQVDTMFENIYLLCIKKKIDTYDIFLMITCDWLT